MDVESRLGRALQRSADGVQPDVPDALREVRGKARGRKTRRRAGVAVAIVGALAAVGLTAQLLTPGSDRGQDPVRPPQDDVTVSVDVVNEATAPDLGLRKLLSVAVAPDGRVYVTDTSQQVAELTPDLEVVRTWGSSGEQAGQLRLVQGSIAVGPDGSVYVSDGGNFRVQEFTPDGEFVRSIGEFGTGPGQFTWPFDVAVDADGNLYVSDDKEQTLAKLAPSGRQLWRIGGLRETDPRLQGHFHLSGFDAQGHLVVTNDDRALVLLLNADGSVAGTAPVTATPPEVCDASVDPSGRYYLTACLAPWRLRVVEPDGTPATAIEDAGLVQAPRWTADGRGYAVTDDGSVVELRVEAG
jgi:sugar lactone lactonase YvrE